MSGPDDSHPTKSAPSVHETPLSSIPAPDTTLSLLSPHDASGLIPYPWDLVAVENSGHSLLVVVHASPAVVKGAGIRETPDEIRLTIYGEKPPAGPVMSVAI